MTQRKVTTQNFKATLQEQHCNLVFQTVGRREQTHQNQQISSVCGQRSCGRCKGCGNVELTLFRPAAKQALGLWGLLGQGLLGILSIKSLQLACPHMLLCLLISGHWPKDTLRGPNPCYDWFCTPYGLSIDPSGIRRWQLLNSLATAPPKHT